MKKKIKECEVFKKTGGHYYTEGGSKMCCDETPKQTIKAKTRRVRAWAIRNKITDTILTFWEDTGRIAIYCSENSAQEIITKKEGMGKMRFEVIPILITFPTQNGK